MQRIGNRSLEVLIKFFPLFYVGFTVFLYYFGPWNFSVAWSGFDWYLMMVLMCLAIGAFVGKAIPVRSLLKIKSLPSSDTFFKWGLFFGVLLLIPTAYGRTGEFYPNFLFALRNPDEVYQRALASISQIEYVRILLAPVTLVIIPYGIHCWERLTVSLKISFLFYLCFTILLFVSMGVNRGIFEIILGVGFLLIVIKCAKKATLNRFVFRLTLLMFFLFALALMFFVNGQINRKGSGASMGYFLAADIYSSLEPLSTENPAVQFIYVLVNQLSVYLAHGYYGAKLIYDVGISETMYGIGHSDFLLRNGVKIFGEILYSESPIYAMEYEQSWEHGNFWFSIIPWIASDLGFSGAIVIITVFSFMYTYSLRCYLILREPLSLAVCYVLFFLFLFFPANNFVVQSGEWFFATYTILVVWVLGMFRVKSCLNF